MHPENQIVAKGSMEVLLQSTMGQMKSVMSSSSPRAAK